MLNINKKPFLILLILITTCILLSGIVLAFDSKKAPVPDKKYFVSPPPLSEGIFPCSSCHEYLEVNKTQRELEFHNEIKLKHAEQQRWCLDCHDAKDRDNLRRSNGELVSFEESYFLCGQCHGTIFRDWKVGLHGKRTGLWNGEKEYRLCVNCHNPHHPKFAKKKPLPPPLKPLNTKGAKTKIIKFEGLEVSATINMPKVEEPKHKEGH